MKRMGAVLLSVFCVLAAVLVLQTSGQPESGEHVAQAATTQAGTGAAAGNAGAGLTGGTLATANFIKMMIIDRVTQGLHRRGR